MLSNKALISFQVLSALAPDIRDSDQEFFESYINAASLRVQDYIGRNLIRKSCTEVHNLRKEIYLSSKNIVSIDSVLYDPDHKFDSDAEELVEGDDYYFISGSRVLNLTWATLPKLTRDSIKVQYTAGFYPITYLTGVAPTSPKEDEIWKDSSTGLVKRYDGESWVSVSEDLIVNDLIIQAVLETVLYYKKRILSNNVGARAQQGSSNLSFYQQVELELPMNVKDMLNGQGDLL
jgi:hypothetical protein